MLKRIFLFILFLGVIYFFPPYSFAQSSPCYNRDLGNLNCDPLGIIDIQDLNILFQNWNPFLLSPHTHQYSFDVNTDNKIDELDLNLLLTRWGPPPLPTLPPIPPLSPVPTVPPFTPDTRMNQTLISVPDQGMGLCWWVSPQLANSEFVNWAYDVNYSWSQIEPREGEYDFSKYDESLALLRGTKKGYLLYFATAETYREGDRILERYPSWLIEKVQRNHPQHWIVYENQGQSYGHFIAPWDPDWQAALDRLAYNLAFKYDNDPNVIGVVVPTGCRYGEMSCWPRFEVEKRLWEAAGYTDERFTQAVEQVITIFLKYFQKKPVYVQLGEGLYGQGVTTSWKLMAEMYSTYGLRVRYKRNSWGSSQTGNDAAYQYFKKYGPFTNVGWEVGYEFNFSDPSTSQNYIDEAIFSKSSYACLGRNLLRKWQEIWYHFSRYAGSHIIMKEFSLSPNQLSPNQNISVSVSFLNRGNKPLVAPKRVGIKDEPASYSLAVWFINKNTAEEEKRIIEPQIPTTQWYGGYPFPTTPPDNPVRIVRGDVLSPQKPGRYEVRIALENSHPGIHQGETWPIITNQQADTQGRYFIGEIQVN